MTATEFQVTDVLPGDTRSAPRWIFSHVWRHKWPLVSLAIGAVSNAALAAVVPMLAGAAFAGVLSNPPDYARLTWAAVGVVVSQLARGILQLGRNFGAELIGQRLERDARAELYASLLGKSMAFHSLRPVGEIMARATNDVRELNFMLNPGLNLIVGSGNFLLMPIIAAWFIRPQLMFVPIVFLAGYFWALRGYLRSLRPITEGARGAFGTMNAYLEEAVEGIETVKGAAREAQTAERFARDARRYRDAFVRQGEVEARFIPFLLLGLAQAGAFLHALLLFRAGEITISQVVAYNGLIALFGFPTFVSLFAYSQVSLGEASARRILELITTPTELDQNPAGHSAPVRGEIEFENAVFGYADSEAPAVQGVNLKIAPGQTVAIVGQTGAGKTTLIKLVNRTYDVTAGAVKVDGVDVRAWNMQSLRPQISIIEQDLFLFSRSVAENIAFGRPDATQAEIEAAAQAAQAHDFILGFKDGYQTEVGERGVTLSGGQRQRLALARAFLANPRILVLDDSTSAIDSATEDQIQRAIFRAAQGRTTLIITHRLSQIRWADQIVVMRRGRIAAVGDHATLMNTSDAYRRIFARYEDK